MPAAKSTRTRRTTTPRASTKKQEDKVFIRNLLHTQSFLRLKKDQGTDREIQLEPRGQRGDTVSVTLEDSEDPNFSLSNGLLFEVLGAEDANTVISKQSINTSRPIDHPALAALRNEYDNPIVSRGAVQSHGGPPGMVPRPQSRIPGGMVE